MLNATATEAPSASYRSSSCSGTPTSTTRFTVNTCTRYGNSKTAQTYQKTLCTDLLPTANPTSAPSGPSYKPTQTPTAAPSRLPTSLPTPAGAVTSGYYVSATYSDASCTKATQMNIRPLGECSSYSSRYSLQYINYVPKTNNWRKSYFTVGMYYDGVCGSLRYTWQSYVSENACENNQMQYFSSSLPQLSNGMMAV